MYEIATLGTIATNSRPHYNIEDLRAVISKCRMPAHSRYAAFRGCGVDRFHDWQSDGTNPSFVVLSCTFDSSSQAFLFSQWPAFVIYQPERPEAAKDCLLLHPTPVTSQSTGRCWRTKAERHVPPTTLPVLRPVVTTAAVSDSLCSSAVPEPVRPLSHCVIFAISV